MSTQQKNDEKKLTAELTKELTNLRIRERFRGLIFIIGTLLLILVLSSYKQLSGVETALGVLRWIAVSYFAGSAATAFIHKITFGV